MAAHEHKYVKISEDDVVVISAHAIPGNETNVTRVIDALYRTGAEVVHDGNAPVHVSGHASQEELKFLLNLRRARSGSSRCTASTGTWSTTRDLADQCGVESDKVFVCEDGDAGHAQRPRTSTSNGRRCRPATSTSTASSATSARACCATGASSPRRAWSS